MRIYNKYIVSLALASCLINTLLAFFDQNNLGIYFTANILAYLAITLLYVYLNPRARKALNTVGAVLFATFILIAAISTTEFLLGK